MGLIGMLAGCQQKAPEAVARGNPPPKPPNCPHLPELANLRLKDGRIADVRIFRDGDETFYIPFSWFDFEAKRNNAGRDDPIEDYWNHFKGTGYVPDVHQVECPGVVHVGAFSYSTPLIMRRANASDAPPPNFSLQSEITQITFDHIYREGFYPLNRNGRKLVKEDIYPYVYSANVMIMVSSDHIANYQNFPYDDEYNKSPRDAGPIWESYKVRAIGSQKWQLWRESVTDLYLWLKTWPKDRDNDRIFELGVKK
ncbi:MAG: hypothetical protein ABIQ66_10405 [Novosphingobium sp.]